MPAFDPPKIYFSTIAIEAHRWKRGKVPTLRASNWIDRALLNGFDGVELWENHYAHADPEEGEALRTLRAEAPGGFILNSYHAFDWIDAEAPRTAAHQSPAPDTADPPAAVQPPSTLLRMIAELEPAVVKFNLGKDPEEERTYRENFRRWTERLRSEINADPLLLCECHHGTVAETPAAAERIFSGPELSGVRYIIHPLSLEQESLDTWLATGRVVHAHLQARDAPLREAPGVEERLLRLMERVPEMSFSFEFVHTLGTPEDDAPNGYQAALEDLETLRDILG
jgi:hypothetical protein